ncbi:MAG: glycosyltransferase family A protein, partial [Planctomycetota bacterium]|nr:glycosyltransferase family A protein [Planctomycetota bacterium]
NELLKVARELKGQGILDRVLIAPDDRKTIRSVNTQWFELDCDCSHTESGVPVSPQLWGFDQVQSRYVLQCDLDILIGRRDPKHDVLADMLAACREEGVVGVAFNIPHDSSAGFRAYDAPSGEYVPEVRCGLLDLERIRACLPLPNTVTDGCLDKTWYRSLQAHQQKTGLRTLRGGDSSTFYIHPPNDRKGDAELLTRIRTLTALGNVPWSQLGRWDLEAKDSDWAYPKRSESLIILARGRDTPKSRIERFSASLAMQTDQSFGVIVIDDASTKLSLRELSEPLHWLGQRLTLVRNHSPKGRMVNHILGVRELCVNPKALVLIVDLDDALFGPTAISQVSKASSEGHDVILAAPFRPDEPLCVYSPDFKDPRSKWGGDVWIHLRAFTKELLDALSDEDFQIDGEWLSECTDYATMVPIVELAKNPVYLPEFLYLHERTTLFTDFSAARRDRIIQDIMAKPSYCRSVDSKGPRTKL